MSRGEACGLTRRLERALLAIGVVSLTWCVLTWFQARAYQREHTMALEGLVAAPPRAAAAPPAPESMTTGSVIGVLHIPRLGVSTVVAEGDDTATLKVAIGHLPDTPMPWKDGNSALAAHRDTFFRPLQHIHVGDELRVSTPHGDFRYHVRETMVVGPNDVWVLDPTDRPTLTLITCYPFRYVGNAPRRFIVRAERTTGAEAKEV
jgi:sortase A